MKTKTWAPAASGTNGRAPSQARGHALMIAATVLVATSFPVGAAITNGLDSLVLTLLRFALAAVLFAPFVAWRYGVAWPGWRALGRYGILSFFLVGFFWGMFVALRHTSALNTATIFALTPTVTAVVAAVLLKDRLSRPARVALPVGMIGAVWVVFRGDLDAFLSLRLGVGDAIFFAATVSLGIYSPLVKRLHRGEPMAQMTFWTLVTGTAWLLILSAPKLAEVDWQAVPLKVYGGIVYLAVFTTIVTFFIYQWAVTVIGPTKVMSYTYLNPGLVLAIALILGKQAPPIATYPGLVLVLAATVILQCTPQPTTVLKPPAPSRPAAPRA